MKPASGVRHHHSIMPKTRVLRAAARQPFAGRPCRPPRARRHRAHLLSGTRDAVAQANGLTSDAAGWRVSSTGHRAGHVPKIGQRRPPRRPKAGASTWRARCTGHPQRRRRDGIGAGDHRLWRAHG
jgi:hypothetical protein